MRGRSTTSGEYGGLGLGIYSLSEASRLSGVPTQRIRRWLRGYSFKTARGLVHSPPVWSGQLDPIDGSIALSFLDLIELRFVDAFIRAGVSWPTMRRAREAAGTMVDSRYPFCTRQFCTDGRVVFRDLEQAGEEPGLVEIVHRQRYFETIMRPFIKELEFADDSMLVRWWPLGPKRHVVVDPHRSFGRPIVDESGVPTDVLSQALEACNDDRREVCKWYEVSTKELSDAVKFERDLVA